jgi:hypothetical protein
VTPIASFCLSMTSRKRIPPLLAKGKPVSTLR